MHIRWMIRRDMPSVLAIEQASFDFAWTEEDFIRCLRQRNVIGMVVEDEADKIVGFMVYELHKAKLKILNMAVGREHRRQGVGSAIIAKLVSKLAHNRRTRLAVELRETNLDAQLFYRANGFKAWRVLRDFYEDAGEDAYLMQYKLPADAKVAAA